MKTETEKDLQKMKTQTLGNKRKKKVVCLYYRFSLLHGCFFLLILFPKDCPEVLYNMYNSITIVAVSNVIIGGRVCLRVGCNFSVKICL